MIAAGVIACVGVGIGTPIVIYMRLTRPIIDVPRMTAQEMRTVREANLRGKTVDQALAEIGDLAMSVTGKGTAEVRIDLRRVHPGSDLGLTWLVVQVDSNGMVTKVDLCWE